jgi:SAM-dependent methyltransferase
MGIDLRQYTTVLRPNDQEIWVAPTEEAVSYPSDGHSACLQIEEESFWFRHRNRCIAAAVARHAPSGPIFDVGGGNGFVALGLISAGHEVVLVEPGYAGASNARRRGLTNVVCATLTSAGFASSLPAVGLFDIIEHVEDDAAFLVAVQRLLRPGGWLYATVPAHTLLWSHEDIDAGHHRRYERRALCQAVRKAGLDVCYATMFFRPLTLPVFIVRALPYRLNPNRRSSSPSQLARDHQVRGGLGVRLMERLLAPEVAHVAAGRELRHGASILLVARKPCEHQPNRSRRQA